MTTLVKGRLWFSLILLFSVHLGFAQAPSGPVVFAFDSPNTAVYDLTGTYTFEQDMLAQGETPVPISLSEIELTLDRQGRLSGQGWRQVMIGSDTYVAARYTARGRVSGGGNTPARVTLSIHLTGNDVISGLLTPFSISISYNLEVDWENLVMIGNCRGHANLGKAGSGPIRSGVVVNLPPGVDGSWVTEMDILPTSRLGGTGPIFLSNGRTVSTKLTGNYSVNTQLARVRLSGTTVYGAYDDRGSTLSMSFFPGASSPERVNGKILGQKVLVQ